MNYCDLVQLADFPSSPGQDLLAARTNRHDLVASWRVSQGLSERLSREFFPHLEAMLDPDRGVRASNLLVSGNAGFGKTHLLAAISAVLQGSAPEDALTHPSLRNAASALAGRFHVVPLAAPGPSTDFLPGLVHQLEAYVSTSSRRPWFRSRRSPEHFKARLKDLASDLRRQTPDKALLLVVDGLARRHGCRDPADLARDAADLLTLAEAGDASDFHLLSDARFGVLHDPDTEIPNSLRTPLAERFALLTLEGEDLFEVAAQCLLPKTTEQRDRIGSHLSRFADQDPHWAAHLETFIDLYPIHPDYLRILGRLSIHAERCVWDVLRGAVQRILNTPIPDDHPGFLTYDDYWHEITRDPRLKHQLEIEGVVAAGRRLERRIRRGLDPTLQPMARRLVRALAIHRLTSTSIYTPLGITADELRTSLGPWSTEIPTVSIADASRDQAMPAESAEPSMEATTAPVEDAPDPRSEPQTPLQWVVHALDAVRALDTDGFLVREDGSGRYGFHFERFRRFVTPEIVLHWVNAIPFLLLMISGGLMLVARLASTEQAWLAFAVLAHKTIAVGWLVSVPWAVLSRPKAHWQHLRVLLRWGPVDLLWMIQSFRSLYFRGAVVPPAPRFNTGQKTNAGLVPFYFFVFGVTGALMHFRGSSLLPWYIHTALYFSALASVGGHLYLALVNPGTRISLPAIFHGWSPMKYVEHHHPLSLPPSRRAHLPPPTARTLREALVPRKVEIVMLTAMVVMASLGAAAFRRTQVAAVKKQFASSFASAINPTRLSIKHRFGPAADNCTRCHTFTGGIPDSRCTECHQVVQDRRNQRLGFHGTLQGPCTECHKEHPAPNRTLLPPLPARFTHDQTTFPLAGAHVQVDCQQCHDRPRPPEVGIHFIGLRHESCVDCHEDPHQNQFTADCTACHTPHGWTGRDLTFSHWEDSEFPLVGRHQQVACDQCHTPEASGASLATARFKGVPLDCAGCHKDPHREPLATKCTACHTPDGWGVDQLTFRHNRDTRFPLTDRHQQVACDQCHQPPSPQAPLAIALFRGTPSDCADCHRDPHRGQFQRNCTQCHSTRGWEKSSLTFDHNRDSRFPLVKKHSQLDCLKCHIPPESGAKLAFATFRGLPSACADCHRDPHAGQFGRECTRCHQEPTRWTGSDLHFAHDRDSQFPLTGRHADVECRKCHVPAAVQSALASATFKGLPTTCAQCHETRHPDTYGTACLSCHDTHTPWPASPPGPQHFQKLVIDGERLSGRHLKTECQTCHVPEKVSGPQAFPSGKGECVSCHRADEPHQGVLGFACGRCHGNQSWSGDDLRFQHNTMSRFRLDENHDTVACAKCHEKGRWKPLKSSCRDCHPQIF